MSDPVDPLGSPEDRRRAAGTTDGATPVGDPGGAGGSSGGAGTGGTGGGSGGSGGAGSGGTGGGTGLPGGGDFLTKPTGLPLWLGGGVAALAAAAMLVGPLAPDDPVPAAEPSPRPSPVAQASPTPSPGEPSPQPTIPTSTPQPTAAPTTAGAASPPAASGATAPTAGGTAPPPVAPGAAPPAGAAGAAAAGSVVAAGAAILPLPAEGLAASADQRATGSAVPVESVVSDEGFWIGSGPGDRLFVQLQIEGESPFQVEAGQLVDLEGTVVPVPADPEGELGVDAAEGRDELVQQGFLIRTDRLALSEG